METIKINASDYESAGSVVVSKKAAVLSKTIEGLVDFFSDNDDITVPTTRVTTDILKKIMEWCEYHAENPTPPIDETKFTGADDLKREQRRTDNISAWDQAFFKDMPWPFMNDLILGASALDIKELLETGFKTIANMMKGMTPDQMCETFGIERDPPETEEEKAESMKRLMEAK